MFNATYGFVGQMNEAGLFVSHHMLKLSVYEERDAARPGSGVCARDVDQWLLASFGSVLHSFPHLFDLSPASLAAVLVGMHALCAVAVGCSLLRAALLAHAAALCCVELGLVKEGG